MYLRRICLPITKIWERYVINWNTILSTCMIAFPFVTFVNAPTMIIISIFINEFALKKKYFQHETHDLIVLCYAKLIKLIVSIILRILSFPLKKTYFKKCYIVKFILNTHTNRIVCAPSFLKNNGRGCWFGNTINLLVKC